MTVQKRWKEGSDHPLMFEGLVANNTHSWLCMYVLVKGF